jgi:hypothetical protein
MYVCMLCMHVCMYVCMHPWAYICVYYTYECMYMLCAQSKFFFKRALSATDFHNWNRVKVRYCDGGSFSGDVETPAEAHIPGTTHVCSLLKSAACVIYQCIVPCQMRVLFFCACLCRYKSSTTVEKGFGKP